VAVILNALRALRPPRGGARRGLSPATEHKLQLGHAELFRGLERLRSIADAGEVYPGLIRMLREDRGLSAMSRAHREIQHVARLLDRTVADLPAQTIDRYLIHDAQRLIITIETLVRIHSAQEDDIYGSVAA
jgi:hypothetical protein